MKKILFVSIDLNYKILELKYSDKFAFIRNLTRNLIAPSVFFPDNEVPEIYMSSACISTLIH